MNDDLFISIIYPNSQDYYDTSKYGSSSTNTSSDLVLDDILDRYSEAWERLSNR